MFLRDKVSFSELDEAEVPFEISMFVLDEIGHIMQSPAHLSAHLMLTLSNYFRGQATSYHYLSEDG